jgi:hypothetical protein
MKKSVILSEPFTYTVGERLNEESLIRFNSMRPPQVFLTFTTPANDRLSFGEDGEWFPFSVFSYRRPPLLRRGWRMVPILRLFVSVTVSLSGENGYRFSFSVFSYRWPPLLRRGWRMVRKPRRM